MRLVYCHEKEEWIYIQRVVVEVNGGAVDFVVESYVKAFVT